MRSFRRAGLLGACLLAVGCTAGTPGSSDDAAARADVVRQPILDHLGLQPGMVVAEIGMGHGWFVFRAAEAVGPQGVVYATDIDAEAIAGIKEQLPNINPVAGHVFVRLCHGVRDTALDDLADDRVDVILMVDSLCFDGSEPHASDVAYLRRFLRILRPGGRLVHHMDCTCAAAAAAVVALFTEAGFSSPVEYVDVQPLPEPFAQDAPCRMTHARELQRFVPVFRKPDRPADAARGAPRT